MIRECDNKSRCHEMRIISDGDALRVICTQCWHQYVLRKDWRGVPNNRDYAKLFKRDILQRSENLFYKYYPQWMSI